MSLADWLENRWLEQHRTSREEIAALLAVADRSLADAAVEGMSSDGRIGHAHAATLAAATAALAAEGYRAVKERHHERVLDSLPHTIGADSRLLKQLHDVRRARNLMTYERVGEVTRAQAEEVVARARAVREAVETWLRARHPELR